MNRHTTTFSESRSRSHATDRNALVDDVRMLKAARSASGIVGIHVPSITLFSFGWGEVDLGFLTGAQGNHDDKAIIYFYPGDRLHAKNDGDLAVGFQKHYWTIVGQLQFNLVGVSSQGPNEQVGHLIPRGVEHVVVADPYLRLALELSLPTYHGSDGIKRYPRLALVAEQGRITRVFRSIDEPKETAVKIIAWLRTRDDNSCVRW